MHICVLVLTWCKQWYRRIWGEKRRKGCERWRALMWENRWWGRDASPLDVMWDISFDSHTGRVYVIFFLKSREFTIVRRRRTGLLTTIYILIRILAVQNTRLLLHSRLLHVESSVAIIFSFVNEPIKTKFQVSLFVVDHFSFSISRRLSIKLEEFQSEFSSSRRRSCGSWNIVFFLLFSLHFTC